MRDQRRGGPRLMGGGGHSQGGSAATRDQGRLALVSGTTVAIPAAKVAGALASGS